MSDRPNAEDLLAASQQHLDLVLAETAALDRYAVRLVHRALSIARAELADGGAAETAEASSLAALLQAAGPASTLRRQLADELRSGRMPLDDPALQQHLAADAARRAAIAQGL